MPRALASILVAALALPRVASAAPPEGPPEAPREPTTHAKIGARSQQGTRRGVLELGIGVLLTGAAASLAAFGTIQFVRAQEQVEFCRESSLIITENEGQVMGIDPCTFDPPPLGFASAGLSWGFSLPLLVGAAMLFVRGAQIAGDARRYRRTQLSVSPWWQRRGAGASVSLRF
ncbi:hypothetical protein ENSA5_19560 [Enhygromyxa salina]|uniref:Uncharacterized protein n=1 Tax=Enhygromyxa salina TaxID=215803 RepID=A0A2S9YD23_9BACT|nr:hypothetical protein [Enhygromyxa salina]PRQ03017.1 hypothetical protein ENSA5_19560 [Enhygromyxa salina]